MQPLKDVYRSVLTDTMQMIQQATTYVLRVAQAHTDLEIIQQSVVLISAPSLI